MNKLGKILAGGLLLMLTALNAFGITLPHSRAPRFWEGGHLYHMKARYYRADLARFISSDPIGISGGLNLYAYAANNPIIFLDALDLCAELSAPGYSSSSPHWLNMLTNPEETMMQDFVRNHGGMDNITDKEWNRQTSWASIQADTQRTMFNLAIMMSMGGAPEIVPAPMNTAYRYVSEGEATVASQSGRVPNVTRTGSSRYVHYSGENFTGAVAAEDALQIGARNPYGVTPSPTHRITVDATGAEWVSGGNVAGGTGSELITGKELPVLQIDPLGR